MKVEAKGTSALTIFNSKWFFLCCVFEKLTSKRTLHSCRCSTWAPRASLTCRCLSSERRTSCSPRTSFEEYLMGESTAHHHFTMEIETSLPQMFTFYVHVDLNSYYTTFYNYHIIVMVQKKKLCVISIHDAAHFNLHVLQQPFLSLCSVPCNADQQVVKHKCGLIMNNFQHLMCNCDVPSPT